jgi:hypothetical protein
VRMGGAVQVLQREHRRRLYEELYMRMDEDEEDALVRPSVLHWVGLVGTDCLYLPLQSLVSSRAFPSKAFTSAETEGRELCVLIVVQSPA